MEKQTKKDSIQEGKDLPAFRLRSIIVAIIIFEIIYALQKNKTLSII